MIAVRSLALLVAAGALALSAGFAVHHLWRGGEIDSIAMLSDEADVRGLLQASMPDLAGKQVSIAQWKGKVLVVNFWATWCAPCREEIPDFVKLHHEFGSKGAQFVGIAADQADKVTQFANEFGIDYPLLIGNAGALELARRVGNKTSSLPFTVVIDRNGKIVYRQLGILKPAKLRALFGEIL